METLSKRLETLKDKGLNVKIGSIGGSSFWYCHPLDDTTTNEIKRLKPIYLNRNTKNLERDTCRLENIDTIYEKETKEFINKGKIKDIRKYLKDREKQKAQEIIRLKQEIEYLNFCIKVPLFLDREVLEVVDGISPDEIPCKIIYVKGCEKGPYWTLKEYANKRKPTEED